VTLPPRSYARKRRGNGIDSPQHRTWIKTFLCVAWERGECDEFHKIECAHAKDIAPEGHGSGGKVSDLFTFPVCRTHHRASEKRERAWSAETGIDLEALIIEFGSKSPDKAIREAARLYITNRGPSPQVTTATVPRFPPDSAEGPSPLSLQRQE